jgi:hypothetical protein
MKKYLTLPLFLASLLFASASSVFAAHHEHESMEEMAPSSVIHVVTVSWKDGASEEDIQKALDGVKQLAKDYDGITRVWIKTLKAQGGKSHAFVMEFKDEQALEDYAGSDAQKAWYEVYIPVRERSATFDITN